MNSEEIFTLYCGKHLALRKRGRWEFADRVDATGAVVVVGITAGNKLLLTEQFRVPCGKNVIELPAGIAGDEPGSEQESLATAAARELEEETGYEPALVREIMTGPSSAGLTSELITIFVATGLTRTGAGGGHAHENITVHEVDFARVDEWLFERIRAGTLIDPKVFAGIHFARNASGVWQ
ncbi:MAG TPA: NUDIX hydrolase [Methylomirabilota bacterium]|nr:NUDIX hydrolase [Methylomirabilota bacterium]